MQAGRGSLSVDYNGRMKLYDSLAASQNHINRQQLWAINQMSSKLSTQIRTQLRDALPATISMPVLLARHFLKNKIYWAIYKVNE